MGDLCLTCIDPTLETCARFCRLVRFPPGNMSQIIQIIQVMQIIQIIQIIPIIQIRNIYYRSCRSIGPEISRS